jgi:AraC-like DNA-binding protein
MAVQRDPVREWREQIARHLLGLDFKPLSDAPFKAAVQPIFQDPRIVRAAFSPGITFRDAELIKKDPDISFAVLIALSGNIFVKHHGRDLQLGRGDATLLHSRANGDVGSPEQFSYMPVLIPHAELATRVVRFDEAIARRIPRQSEALQLLRGYICALKNGRFGRKGRLILRQHLVDLAALAITPHGALGESNLSAVVSARLGVVLDHIASHFSDPELSLTRVARRLSISPRYLQRLLKTSGTSFTAHVTELRLKHAFMLLTAENLLDVHICAVALQAGFSDISHFNRLFRSRFGDTPKGVRAPARMGSTPDRIL